MTALIGPPRVHLHLHRSTPLRPLHSALAQQPSPTPRATLQTPVDPPRLDRCSRPPPPLWMLCETPSSGPSRASTTSPSPLYPNTSNLLINRHPSNLNHQLSKRPNRQPPSPISNHHINSNSIPNDPFTSGLPQASIQTHHVVIINYEVGANNPIRFKKLLKDCQPHFLIYQA